MSYKLLPTFYLLVFEAKFYKMAAYEGIGNSRMQKQ